MPLGLGIGAVALSPAFAGVGETSAFDPTAMAGKRIMAPRWPLVGSLPGTVVDGQRLRIAEVGQDYGREYLGVDGAWVPQDTVTMARWVWDGIAWSLDVINLRNDDGDLLQNEFGDNLIINEVYNG